MNKYIEPELIHALLNKHLVITRLETIAPSLLIGCGISAQALKSTSTNLSSLDSSLLNAEINSVLSIIKQSSPAIASDAEKTAENAIDLLYRYYT